MGELKWFLIALVVMWLLWVVTGGYTHVQNINKPFLEQPTPIENGQPYTLQQLKDSTRP
ncbi:MAG TPA: hypothetical protein VG982_02225 [Candidatus Paceibacterota bacterium]|nr:hypothetical protein [Candidatus Paceibacterota bacterium]